jgi:plastocyanin
MWKILLVALCVLWMVPATESAQKEKPKKDVVEVSIKDRQFSPADVTIKVGQTVRWTNHDDMDHGVDGKDGTFSSGTIKSKKTYEYAFAKKGKYPYSCKLHPRMKGTVTVE